MRMRVLEAARKLNYQPDQTAQRLRSQTTSSLIGLLISGINNAHFHSVVQGVSDLAYNHQLNLMLCNVDGSLERERYYLDLMQSERAAGLIINPQDYYTDGQRLDELRRQGIAVVLIDTSVARGRFDQVRTDGRGGAYRGVRHLVGLGHQRIGIVTGTTGIMTATERLNGYRDALTEAGIPVDDALICDGRYEKDGAHRATLQLLDLPAPPTALFVSNELMTLGTLEALRERGVRVPQELALVGFDDIPWSPYLSSPLTTVAQPTYAVGREAVRLLLRRLAEPDAPPLDVVLQNHLVVRESCGAGLR
jgi:DNA-binding LacI/PurR family transcriptional regulator